MSRRPDGRTACVVCGSFADRCLCFGPPPPRHAQPSSPLPPLVVAAAAAAVFFALLWIFHVADEARGLHDTPPAGFWPAVEAAFDEQDPQP